MPGGGVNNHPGGFVDHGEVFVFIDDVERYVLGDGPERRGVGLAGNLDALAGLELERGLHGAAIDEDIALVEEQLDARAADVFDGLGEELVETAAGAVFGHFDDANGRFCFFSHATLRGSAELLRGPRWRAGAAEERPREREGRPRPEAG